VPEISYFYGIRITINWTDHNPPHFHARYSEHQATIQFAPHIGILAGGLPRTALTLCLQWAAMHQQELLEAWNRAQQKQAPGRIAPLD
jgi:hypothetical protein